MAFQISDFMPAAFLDDFDLLKRLHYLSLVAERAGGVSLLGGPRKKIPGGGTEVTGIRDYVPGDEYRYIDWTLCARRDELMSKVFEGDEDRHGYILLDCSRSMGQGNPPKLRLARQIAAVLGYTALMKLDQIGLCAFADGVVDSLPPLRGKTRIPRLLQFLRHLTADASATDLTRTAEAYVRRYQRRGTLVLISDLYDPHGFQRAMDIFRNHGYDLRVVQIYDPREAEAAHLGDVELWDVESGSVRPATITERAAARYRTLFGEFLASVRDYCSRSGVTCLQLTCDMPEDTVLLNVLRREPARRFSAG